MSPRVARSVRHGEAEGRERCVSTSGDDRRSRCEVVVRGARGQTESVARQAAAAARSWQANGASDMDSNMDQGSAGKSTVVWRNGDQAWAAVTCRRLTAGGGLQVRRARGSRLVSWFSVVRSRH